MTKPSLRSVFKLLTYCFAALGAFLFFSFIISVLFTNHATPAAAETSPFQLKSASERIAAWRESAAKGDQDARYWLARELYQKNRTPDETKEGLALLRDIAATGDQHLAPEAAFTLGMIYSEALGVPRDASEAAKYRSIAAKDGALLASAHLALAHLKGDGVAKDENEARRLLERAVDVYRDADIAWYSASSGNTEVSGVSAASAQPAGKTDRVLSFMEPSSR